MSGLFPTDLFYWKNDCVPDLITVPAFTESNCKFFLMKNRIIMNNETKYISYRDALVAQKRGKGVIIDVREPAEFRDGHIPYAINLPSTRFAVEDYQAWHHLKVYLVCQSGSRAQSIAQELSEAGVEEVYVLDRHMEQIATETTSEVWSVDRQFRFVLGVFIALYLIGYHWISVLFSIIPVILCLGLIISAMIDKCYFRVGIAMLPWNREAPDRLQILERLSENYSPN